MNNIGECNKSYNHVIDNCEGGNPCLEITLAPYESCVLAEIVLPRVESQEELNDIARLLYKTQKAAAALPSHWKQVNDIVSKNMRIGLGVTGLLQAQDKIDFYKFDSLIIELLYFG